MTAAEGVKDGALILAEARRVLRLEAAAVAALEGRLEEGFVDACRLLAETPGRVIVSGIGKSGIVARKIAATLTSTGTPATFLHPVEGLHGDLGIVTRADVALLVSKSGETSELLGLIGYLLRLDIPIIALTGQRRSSLGRHARVVLDCSVDGGGLSPGPGSHLVHHGGARHGGCPGRGGVPDEGLPPGRFHASAPQRSAGT